MLFRSSTVCAGLASGLYALRCGADFLKFGRARILLTGGLEELCEESVLGFRKAGVISPHGCPRPFAKDRDGTVLGEGSALMVLEQAETAAQRGARPWVEVCGFGNAHDAQSITAFRVEAEGATAAIEQALASAEVAPKQVSCIVSCASGSRPGDEMEARALDNVFGSHLEQIPVCAPKAAVGEAMGAAGAFSALVGAIALRKQLLPPTAGFTGSETNLQLSARDQQIEGEYALINAFGCDGNNASVVLRRWTE